MATTETGRVPPTDGPGTGAAPALEHTAICLCSPHYPPVLSGVGDYTYFLAVALSDLGCTVHVLTSAGQDDPVHYPGHPGVLVHRDIRDWGLRGLRTLVEVVRSLPCDTICIQYAPHAYDRRGLTLAVNLVPALLRLTTVKSVVVNYHEMYISFDWSFKRTAGSLWQRTTALFMGACSNHLLANCVQWQSRLRRIGVRKPIPVIPVGSNIPRVPAAAAELAQVRSKFFSAEEGVLVGCFGSAEPHRDATLLREALRRVGDRISLRTVWLGHSGQSKTSMDESGIFWTGSLPHPEISRIMSACDMFVLPFTDGVSTRRGTLAAALLHELPVLTTRGQTVDEIFVHGKNIYMVPVADPVALADAIVLMATSPALRQRLSQGAGELHRTHFSWSVIARQVLDVVSN